MEHWHHPPTLDPSFIIITHFIKQSRISTSHHVSRFPPPIRLINHAKDKFYGSRCDGKIKFAYFLLIFSNFLFWFLWGVLNQKLRMNGRKGRTNGKKQDQRCGRGRTTRRRGRNKAILGESERKQWRRIRNRQM